MAKSASLTASGLVKTGTGNLYKINITKPGDATASVTLYDNTSGSGTIIFQASGSASGAMLANSYDMSSDGTQGTIFVAGCYAVFTGATLPILNVIYD
jgi:hypothetical protein